MAKSKDEAKAVFEDFICRPLDCFNLLTRRFRWGFTDQNTWAQRKKNPFFDVYLTKYEFRRKVY